MRGLRADVPRRACPAAGRRRMMPATGEPQRRVSRLPVSRPEVTVPDDDDDRQRRRREAEQHAAAVMDRMLRRAYLGSYGIQVDDDGNPVDTGRAGGDGSGEQ